MTRDNNKKTHYVVLGGKGGGQAESVEWNDILNKPEFATVATTGDYDDLNDKPTIPTVPAMAVETLTFTLQGGTVKTIDFYTVPNYFYVEDISGSNNTLAIKNASNTNPVEVFKSTDRTNWTSMGTTNSTGITATIPANGKLYLKATANSWGANNISANKNHNIGGNIMSLLYGDNFEGQTTFPTNSTSFNLVFIADTKMINAESLVLPATTLNAYCYQNMFQNCTSLTTAPALPATTLAQNCYSNMFNGCTSLTETPALPATTLAKNCYNGMFSGCSTLTTAPALPATTLADYCYDGMFYGCTSLTTTPTTLPSTTLADYCYSNMFNGCTSLTQAPALPATTLAERCYQAMFYRCTNLNKVITYATNISAKSCLNSWLNNVSATGDFYNLGSATYPSGTSGIPTGWTVHTSL